MPEAWVVPAAAVPLIVAFFNLVLAGHVARGGSDLSRRGALGSGALGIALFALAWFVAALEPPLRPSLGPLVAAAGTASVVGFALDALFDLPRRSRMIVASTIAALTTAIVFATGSLGLRGVLTGLGVGLAATVVVARLELSGTGAPALRLFSRKVFQGAALAAAAYAFFATVRLTAGHGLADPILGVLLIAQTSSLVYVSQQRLRPRVLGSTAFTYALAFAAAAFVGVVVVRALGLEIDPFRVSLSVAIGLSAAVALVMVAEVANAGLLRLVFPEHARLASLVGASRAELASIRRRLERAERLAIVGELSASIAHDIKNPLSPIRTYAQLLESKLDSVDAGERELFARGLSIVVKETDRIDARVRELLAVARAERTKSNRVSELDLLRVVVEAAMVAESDEGPRIEADLPAEPLLAVGDADEIRGVLMNLIENAKEAMVGTDGSRIELRAFRDGARAVVEVDDEGTGLAEDVAARLFQPFFTTKESGTGLGLAISRSAVEASGGAIRLGPRPDKRGARARVELVAAGDDR